MNAEKRYFEFVRLPSFESTAKGILKEEEIRRMEEDLVANPWAGDLIAQSGGVRKLRVATEGRGKRGSTRVVYVYIEDRETIYLLFAFPKNMQANLTAAEKQQVRKLVAQIRGENRNA